MLQKADRSEWLRLRAAKSKHFGKRRLTTTDIGNRSVQNKSTIAEADFIGNATAADRGGRGSLNFKYWTMAVQLPRSATTTVQIPTAQNMSARQEPP